jgi:hypothetical protein
MRLAQQLGTGGMEPDVVTLLTTIKELQDSLARVASERDELAAEVEELREPEGPAPIESGAASNAERALARIVHGQCSSQSASHWTSHVRMHRGMEAGYHARQLASELAMGRATIGGALEVIAELCETIDALHHQVEDPDAYPTRRRIVVKNCNEVMRAIRAIADREGRAVTRFYSGEDVYIGAPVTNTLGQPLFFGARTRHEAAGCWHGALTWCHWAAFDDGTSIWVREVGKVAGSSSTPSGFCPIVYVEDFDPAEHPPDFFVMVSRHSMMNGGQLAQRGENEESEDDPTLH